MGATWAGSTSSSTCFFTVATYFTCKTTYTTAHTLTCTLFRYLTLSVVWGRPCIITCCMLPETNSGAELPVKLDVYWTVSEPPLSCWNHWKTTAGTIIQTPVGCRLLPLPKQSLCYWRKNELLNILRLGFLIPTWTSRGVDWDCTNMSLFSIASFNVFPIIMDLYDCLNMCCSLQWWCKEILHISCGFPLLLLQLCVFTHLMWFPGH